MVSKIFKVTLLIFFDFGILATMVTAYDDPNTEGVNEQEKCKRVAKTAPPGFNEAQKDCKLNISNAFDITKQLFKNDIKTMHKCLHGKAITKMLFSDLKTDDEKVYFTIIEKNFRLSNYFMIPSAYCEKLITINLIPSVALKMCKSVLENEFLKKAKAVDLSEEAQRKLELVWKKEDEESSEPDPRKDIAILMLREKKTEQYEASGSEFNYSKMYFEEMATKILFNDHITIAQYCKLVHPTSRYDSNKSYREKKKKQNIEMQSGSNKM